MEKNHMEKAHVKNGHGRARSRLFMVSVIGPWVLLAAIVASRSYGSLLMGRTAFFLLLLSRVCLVLIALELCFFLFMLIKSFPLRLLALAGAAAVIFLALHNPLADLCYLNHPVQADMRIMDVNFNTQYADYSTFYHLKGVDEKGQKLSFRINRSSYKLLRKRPRAKLHVTYLPHTKHVLTMQ